MPYFTLDSAKFGLDSAILLYFCYRKILDCHENPCGFSRNDEVAILF
ncbi:hypothetical protein ACWIUD_06980 [Helicobacter sp. 23-1044]